MDIEELKKELDIARKNVVYLKQVHEKELQHKNEIINILTGIINRAITRD